MSQQGQRDTRSTLCGYCHGVDESRSKRRVEHAWPPDPADCYTPTAKSSTGKLFAQSKDTPMWILVILMRIAWSLSAWMGISGGGHVDDKMQLRANVVAKVGKLLLSPDFRDFLLDGTGDSHHVIALEDDTVSYVFDRLREHGGPAKVIVETGDELHVLDTWPATPADAGELDELKFTSLDSDMGMFVEFLRGRHRQAVICALSASDVQVKLLGEETPALAGL